jgi:predicted small metal-binding protein
MNCTVAIFADSKDEVVEAAVQHMKDIHGHEDSQELRKNVREVLHKTEEDVPAR